MKLTKIHIALLFCVCGLSLLSAQTTLNFSFTEGMGKRGETYAYPLMLNDTLATADSLLAGEMTFSGGESVYDIVGIQKTGTMLDSAADVQFNPLTGKLSFAHTQPITGTGIFIEFLIAIRSNANGTDQTTLQNIVLNEGNILGLISPGSMRPMNIFINPKNPPQDRIVGDTIQFTATGDVHLPLTWSVGDTHVVSVDGTGRVIGKNIGQTTVTVTDDIGLTDVSMLMPVHPPTLRSLTISVPTMSVTQNLTFLLPVTVSTVTGLGITSAQFRLTYDPNKMTPLGVIDTGSLTAQWTEPTVMYGSNYLDIALAGTEALTDSGALVFIQFKMKRYALFSSSVNLTNVLFNENLNATVKNGTITALQGPLITLSGKPATMIPGETALLGVTGGTPPHRWKITSDTAVASIDSVTGLMTAKKRGIAAYSAIDLNGFDGSDSVTVTDVRFHFPDTSFIYTDSIDYPVLISSTDGLGIISAQMTFTYDSARIQFVTVIRGGTATGSMLMELKDSAGLRFAFSSAAPLNGAGQFFVLRFKSKGLASIGHTQPMFFSQTTLNEAGNAVRTASQRMGSLAITNVPNYPPLFTDKLRDTTISENQLLQFQLKAADANNDTLIFGLFSGISGMSVTPKGLFTWQPNYNQAGIYSVVYDVGDFRPDGVTKDSAKITVLNVNRLPLFTREFQDTTIAAGLPFSFDFDGFDPDGTPVAFGLLNAAAGMAIDTISGLFTWTPTAVQVGMFDVVVRIVDKDGGAAVREVMIESKISNVPPVFTQFFTDTTIQEDQPLAFTIAANDPNGDIVHYYIQNIQPGMNIDTNSGAISWKPTFQQAGTYNIAFIANDGKGGFANKPAVINVANVNRPPVFTGSLPDTLVITAGQTVNVQFTGSDPDNDELTFTLLEGPAGSTLTPAGIFSWGPLASQAGMHRTVISLADGSAGVQDTMFIKVTVNNSPPSFTRTLPDTTVAEMQQLQYQYSAADPDLDSLQWQLAGNPPQGLSFSAAGVLQWTPGYTQSGTYAIVVSVSDGQFSLLDSALVTVTNTNRAPQFTQQLPDSTIIADSSFTFMYKGSDPDADSISYSLLKGPSGSSFTSAGLLSWKPSVVGKETVIVALSDGLLSVRDTAVITISGFPVLFASVTEIDFGTTVFGSLPVKSAVIRNTGKVPLVLQRIPGVPNEQHFTTDVQQQSVLQPQGELTITFTYTPQQIGQHVSGVAFQTNDPKYPNFGFLLKGTAISVAAVQRKVLVDLTHEPRIPLRDSTTGMTQLFGALKKSGVEIAFAETSFTPTGYDVVLLVSPLKLFTESEKASLRQFIQEGGMAVMMDDPTPESGLPVINELLRDSLLASGMLFHGTPVSDSTHNYFGDPSAPMITQFADTKHPFLNSVDSLVLFGGGFILTDSSAIPFAQATSPSPMLQMEGKTAAVIGSKKIGKGTLMVIGNTALWRNSHGMNEQVPVNIAAKDNFTFALNLFSIEENFVFSMPEKTPNEIYQLISIPLDLKETEILPLLKASLGEIDPLKWRLFGKYNPTANRYREFPSAGFTHFTRGEAYWLITRGEFPLTFGSATVLPAQDFFPVTIGPGYSMIGNPFPYAVSWKDSRIGDSVQTVLWRFNSGTNTFVPESLTLAPFTGYFVKNLSKDSTTIYINPRKEQFAKRGTDRAFADDEWKIRIGAVSGKAADAENYAGVHPGAAAELDRFDAAEPPTTPTDFISVRFTNSGWKNHRGSYAVDIRPVTAEGAFWDFDVTSSKGQSRVRLNFEQLGRLPDGFGLYLVDKGTERVTRFDRSVTYEFTMARNQTRQQFRLLAGKQEYAENNTNGIPLIAMDYELRQNFPNPFNPATSIRYTIGHSGTVLLEVFNVLGQKVRLLRNEMQQIGTYAVEWDGKDETGELVASGVYFFKVTVSNNNEKLFTQTKKMILMK